MANKPSERINFVIERWARALRVKAFLYEGETLTATASRSIPLSGESAEYIRMADLMDVCDSLRKRCELLRDQAPLPLW